MMEGYLVDALPVLMVLGISVLAVTGVGCLIWGKGRRRRYLVWTAAVFLGTLGLYFSGLLLLSCFGLTWRNLPTLVLWGVALLSGWAGTILIPVCFWSVEMPEQSVILGRAAKAAVAFFAAVVLFVTLWLGPLVLAFVYGSPERVVEYQGQTLLEENDGFLDLHYSYYAYHGPLFRGAERVWDGPARIDGDIN